MRIELCAKVAVIAMLAMTIIGVSPLALAQEDAAGSATGGNVAPLVTSVTAPDTVDSLVEYNFPCTVSDANTLADITTVVLKLYVTTVGEAEADAKENHYTFTFTASDNTWTETGPGPGNEHLITESCTYPSDLSVQADNYKFVVKLAGIAKPTTWTAKWIATDDNDASGNNTDVFTVTDYIALGIDDKSLTFSGNPGDTDIAAGEAPTICTVTANNTFKVQARLSGDWMGTTHGGTIAMSNTEAAQDVDKTAGVKTLSTTYADIWTGVSYGEDVAKNLYWFLDFPDILRDDVYTTTVWVNAAKEA